MKKYINANMTDILNEPLSTRIAAARNPKTRPTVLTKLAEDPNPNVRNLVLHNPNTPKDIKIDFGEDEIEEWDLSINFYTMEELTPDEIGQLDNEMKDIIEYFGGEFVRRNWYENLDEDDENSYPDVHDMDWVIIFRGADDDEGNFTAGIQGELCNLLLRHNYDVGDSEYF